MSRMIEVSDQDYARIQRAAEIAGVPVDEWIVGNLPLNGSGGRVDDQPLPRQDGKPTKTMYDLLKGHVGVVDTGGTGRLSERHSDVFGEMLEEQQRAEGL